MAGRILGAWRPLFLIVVGVPLSVSFAAAEDATPAAGASSPVIVATPTPAPTRPRADGGVTSALVVNDAGGQTLLGLRVQTSKGEDLGHVVDVVVDRSGALLAAIVDFGGFLGVGSRKIAVDWRILHFPKTDGMDKLVADLSVEQVRSAPAYKPGEPIVVMGAPATPTPSPTGARSTPEPSALKP